MSRAPSHFNHFSPPSSTWSNTKSMAMITQVHYQDYWASIEAQIEAFIKKTIPVRPPVDVFEPMHNLVMTAPKTKASTLCIAAFDLVGDNDSSNNNSVVAAASALHFVHAAAHLHGNLPLTDGPSLNFNVGTMAQHTYNPNVELLIGDGLFSFGLEILAKSMDPAQKNASQILRVIVEISRAMKSLFHGQWNESEMGEFDGCDDVWIGQVCQKKEGAMYACGAACGAILGGGSEEEIERLRKYGLYVGLIHGIIKMSVGINRDVTNKGNVIERLKELAMVELEHFKSGRNVEPFIRLVLDN